MDFSRVMASLILLLVCLVLFLERGSNQEDFFFTDFSLEISKTSEPRGNLSDNGCITLDINSISNPLELFRLILSGFLAAYEEKRTLVLPGKLNIFFLTDKLLNLDVNLPYDVISFDQSSCVSEKMVSRDTLKDSMFSEDSDVLTTILTKLFLSNLEIKPFETNRGNFRTACIFNPKEEKHCISNARFNGIDPIICSAKKAVNSHQMTSLLKQLSFMAPREIAWNYILVDPHAKKPFSEKIVSLGKCLNSDVFIAPPEDIDADTMAALRKHRYLNGRISYPNFRSLGDKSGKFHPYETFNNWFPFFEYNYLRNEDLQQKTTLEEKTIEL